MRHLQRASNSFQMRETYPVSAAQNSFAQIQMPSATLHASGAFCSMSMSTPDCT